MQNISSNVQPISQSAGLWASYPIGKTFGIQGVPDSVCATGLTPPSVHPREAGIPDLDPTHVFDRAFLREIVSFLKDPYGDALKIYGPMGTGKSSGAIQVCARLNWPVVGLTATGSLEFISLVGGFQLVQVEAGQAPVMKFIYGPLASAMKYGKVLLINEYDYAQPEEMAGLNDIIQGMPLFIEATGEVIYPHPAFRIIVTGNTAGNGDEQGIYPGVLIQNGAANDRYRIIESTYLAEEDEIAIVDRSMKSQLPQPIIKKMVEVANAVRAQFVAPKDGVRLSSVISTRGIKRWAHLTLQFNTSPKPLKYALEQSLLRGISETDRLAIDKIAEGIFGNDWKEVV